LPTIAAALPGRCCKACDTERMLRIKGTVVEKKVQQVIEMEVERTNREDVAEPDAVVSGTAGTGQENKWARRHLPPDPYLAERKTEIIGWGVRTRHTVRKKRSVQEREPA